MRAGIERGGAAALPLNLIAQAIPKLTRHELEAVTERLIDYLDQQDGDPEMEDDDPAGQCDEEGISTGFWLARSIQAGCAISEGGGI